MRCELYRKSDFCVMLPLAPACCRFADTFHGFAGKVRPVFATAVIKTLNLDKKKKNLKVGYLISS